MKNRVSAANRRWTIVAALLLLVVAAPFAQITDRARTEAQAKRANDRLQALQREASDLAAQERSLLTDLRRLEVERDLKTEQLKQLDGDMAKLSVEVGNIANQIDALEAQIAELRPKLEARMVQLYKLGSAGYVRMLFNVSDLKEFGRAYRLVSALAAVDRQRALDHRQTIEQLRVSYGKIEQRRKAMAKLQQDARNARFAAEQAATARAQLIAQIDLRRDLTAELAGELHTAQQKLQQTLGSYNSGAPRPASDGSALPIRPFRGVLDWPAAGRVMSRFGRPGVVASTTTSPNGIQISVAEGTPVTAIHDGTVRYAAPFTGYGNLVIIDHGSQTYSMYGQLGAIQTEEGARVDRGDTIGAAGRVMSGFPGVYFEMRVDGKPVDPLEWLKKTP